MPRDCSPLKGEKVLCSCIKLQILKENIFKRERYPPASEKDQRWARDRDGRFTASEIYRPIFY